jgi:hypothetical protein
MKKANERMWRAKEEIGCENEWNWWGSEGKQRMNEGHDE